jgi:TM2 domain-containing membrane protein YozV
MANILNYMPELDPDEMAYIQQILQNMTDQQAQQFVNIYRSRRKDSQIVLLTALIGFFGVAGVHRFLVGNIGLGIVYLLTAGFCFIGTIVDVINHKKIAFDYNIKEARFVQALIAGQTGGMGSPYVG